MISAFMYAVIKSIIHRKELENHAWWLISTVFIIMMPALSRGIQAIQIMHYGLTSDLNPTIAIIVGSFIILGLIIITAYKYNHLKHPATYLAIAVNIFNCFLEPIGKSAHLQIVLDALIKG
jgi:hypothetical protein